MRKGFLALDEAMLEGNAWWARIKFKMHMLIYIYFLIEKNYR